MELGPHGGFIIAAYGATALILGGLVLRTVLDYRAQTRLLAELERRGVRRLSDTPAHDELASPGAPRRS